MLPSALSARIDSGATPAQSQDAVVGFVNLISTPAQHYLLPNLHEGCKEK